MKFFKMFWNDYVKVWTESIEMRTLVSVADIISRMDSLGQREPKFFSFNFSKLGKVRFGLKGESLKLIVPISYRNPFQPIFLGRVIGNEKGTTISGVFRLQPPVRIFSFVWLGLLGSIGVLALGQTFYLAFFEYASSPLRLKLAMMGTGIGFILVGVGVMTVSYIFLVRICKYFSKNEIPLMKNFLISATRDEGAKP